MPSSIELNNKLTNFFGKQHAGIAVLLYHKGTYCSAAINHFSSSHPVYVGCIAKTLTSTLVAIAMAEHGLSLDDSVDTVLHELAAVKRPVLMSNITLGQLLNHSSGLDHSTLPSLPRDKAGFICQASLISAFSSSIIAPPGKLFCYSPSGAWLAAFILEQIYHKPYATLLAQKIFKPIGIACTQDNTASQICPATGNNLALSAEALMKLVLLHMQLEPAQTQLLKALLCMRTYYPFKITSGVMLKGAISHPVWFDHGGSFGQSGHSNNTSAAIRFLPDQDIAIVVTAQHPRLHHVVMAMLFADLLPDFKNISIPTLHSSEEWQSMDISAYQGIFENKQFRLHIDTAANGALRAKAFFKQTDDIQLNQAAHVKRYYKAAQGHLFLSLETSCKICPTLQFSHPDKDGKFRYINTGSLLFSRTA